MNKQKKQIAIFIISIISLATLALIGVTYAYYRTKVVGNENAKSVSVTSTKLELTYSDGNGTFTPSGYVLPGYNNEDAKKTFTVENTGDETVMYTIVFDEVINEFIKGRETRGEYNDWTYKLYQGNTVVKEGEITTDTKQYILEGISIAPQQIHTYSLVVYYKYLSDVDQTDDMNSSLSLKINIEAVSEE